MSTITFRNSKIVYYGPYPCDNCGVDIVKMADSWGGSSFTNPSGPIYPNTEWHPHVCDPKLVGRKAAVYAMSQVKFRYPFAVAQKIGELGWVILECNVVNPEGKHLAFSPNQTFYSTEDSAWIDAHRRQNEGLPTWYIGQDGN